MIDTIVVCNAPIDRGCGVTMGASGGHIKLRDRRHCGVNDYVAVYQNRGKVALFCQREEIAIATRLD